MRGERLPALRHHGVLTGSSPHARGTHARSDLLDAVVRFIPACAGNAVNRKTQLTSVNGSSPHARGTPMKYGLLFIFNRFIPACAGNAPQMRSSTVRLSVHPRMRGERTCRRWAIRTSGGSSPHARGTQVLRVYEKGRQRFIPACAGNAGFTSIMTRCFLVHPRMRGERCCFCPRSSLPTGSSPHARGTHFQ